MKKMRGLVISWYYPPGNSSEGLVTYKLLKNSDFEYDVFTRGAQDASMWDRKVDESDLVADNVTVYQSKIDSSDEPIEEDEWIEEAVEFFKKNSDKYDFVMSRIMSRAAHVAAARIKEICPDIFWVASFGDPLVNSPYLQEITADQNPYFLGQYYVRELPAAQKTLKLAISPTRRARKKIWEKDRIESMKYIKRCREINDETFEKADLLIFNNKQQYERAFIDEYAKYKKKGAIVPHSFDTSLYPKKNTKKNDGKVHFVYVGHLDAMRNATALFDVLGIIKEHDKKLNERVQFDFYGHIGDGDKVAMVDNDICDLVTLHGDVNYVESLKIMKDADWLLLIDANLNYTIEEYIYLPAKLMDYFGAEKNILAITHMRGATADAVRSTQTGQVVTHCATEIATYLSKIIYQGYKPAKYKANVLKKYDAKNVAAGFDKLIESRIGMEK